MTTGAYSTIQPVYANGVPIPELGLAVGPQALLGPWDSLASYVIGDEVTNAGHLYRCTALVAPDTRIDTFVRDDDPDGWGTASDGHVWASEGGHATESLVADQGVIAADSFGSTDLMFLGAALAADQDMLVRWTAHSTADPAHRDTGALLLLRYQDTNNRATLVVDVDGSGGLRVCLAGDAPGPNGTGVPGGGSMDTPYWTRFRAVGAVYSWRTWADGDAEPGTWDGTYTDMREGGLGSGLVGLWSNPDDNHDSVSYDHFSATTFSSAPAADPDHWALLA